MADAGGTADVKVYGNIMSLVDEKGFAKAKTLTEENAFRRLFFNNIHIFFIEQTEPYICAGVQLIHFALPLD